MSAIMSERVAEPRAVSGDFSLAGIIAEARKRIAEDT